MVDSVFERAKANSLIIAVIGGTGIGLGATYGFVALVSAVGFKAAGIAAGSGAAKMMSASAIASGGGIAKGGLVASLQSVGALGAVSTATQTAVSTLTGATAGLACKYFKRE